MPTDFLDLQTTDCTDCIGGIVETIILDNKYIDISGVTVDANMRITAIVASTPGKIAILTPDTDDTARYDSVGERNNNVHRNNTEAFLKFGCITATKVTAAEMLRKSCSFTAFHKHASGLVSVQGIDVIEDGVNYTATFSKSTTKATVSAFSGTGAEEDRIEATLNGVSRNVLVLIDGTILTYDDLLAL
jgi:hypothetical protein